MRKVAAILIFLVLTLRAVVPALPMYVCMGMGAAHLYQPCCAGSEEAGVPALTAGCCKPEQGATVDAALPPGKSGVVVSHQPAFIVPASTLFPLPRLAGAKLLLARAPPWPIGPPPPLRAILRI